MLKKIFFILISMLILEGSPGLANEIPFTIITEAWPPYNYQEAGMLSGFSTEIVRAIMQELGVDYPLRLLPGARGEKLLNEGHHIMSFSLFRTAERETRYKWIGPIAEDAIYFYKKKGSPIEIHTLDDARHVKRVACRHKGFVYHLLEQEDFTNLDLTPDPLSIIKKGARGRVDLSIGETPLGVAYWLKQANLPEDALEQTPVRLAEFPLYIACTRDVPDDEIRRWQTALDALKTSGRYDQIYQKYLGNAKHL